MARRRRRRQRVLFAAAIAQIKREKMIRRIEFEEQMKDLEARRAILSSAGFHEDAAILNAEMTNMIADDWDAHDEH